MEIDFEDIDDLIGSNKLTSLASYYWRDLYKDFGLPSDLEIRSIDLWYDRMFYGRIDYNNAPEYPKQSSLKQLKGDGNHFAVNFVADAWEDFKEFVRSNNLDTTGSIYAALDPHSAWQSVTSLYHEMTPACMKFLQESL